MLAATSVCSQPPRYDWNPLYGTVYRHFLQGSFDLQMYPIRLQKFNPDWPEFAHLTSWNAGELIGLTGFSSLFPLFLLLAIAALIVFKLGGSRGLGRGAVASSPNSDPLTIEKAEKVLNDNNVAVFIVSYNAESTVESVLERIPSWVSAKLAEVFVIDDSSTDGTMAKLNELELSNAGVSFKIYKTPFNLGYGGNQKLGYAYAVRRGFDIVVLLHGDGQYAPEYLPAILAVYSDPSVSAVFGSRFAEGGAPLAGGMPLYKWIGNQVLTKIQNVISGAEMSEMHSGYRSYRLKGLERIPFDKNSNDFHFDAEIILQHLKAGLRIREVPIPTFYGDEICYVNGMRYAWNCLKTVVKFRLMSFGIFYDPKFAVLLEEKSPYSSKFAKTSLHHHVRNLTFAQNARIADIGGGNGSAIAGYFAVDHSVLCVDANVVEVNVENGVEMISCDLDGKWDFYRKS
ncbi:MAG: glycosyltransferase family 2 protein, partial [Victivallales bacterium]|nr:glycosyltransferase family 2 protein [Victivallales bacterium]